MESVADSSVIVIMTGAGREAAGESWTYIEPGFDRFIMNRSLNLINLAQDMIKGSISEERFKTALVEERNYAETEILKSKAVDTETASRVVNAAISSLNGYIGSNKFNRMNEPPHLYNQEVKSTGEEAKAPAYNYYLPYYVTEGDHRKTDDKLDFKYDIESIASVISLREVKPPLAIGLFGNWGSGKSFFMEKLCEKIDEYSHRKTDDKYVKNVVQVKFNSWHYSDSNLWASLITEIFDSLNTFSKNNDKLDEIKKLSETLEITNTQKEAIESKRQELEEKINLLKAEQSKKREKLENLSGFKLLKLVLSDKQIKQDLKGLGNENIENIIKDSPKLDSYIEELRETKDGFINYFLLLKNFKSWKWALVLLTALIIFSATYIIPKYFSVEWKELTLWLSGIISLASAFTANAVKLIYPVKKSLNESLKRVESLRKTLTTGAGQEAPEIEESVNELKKLKKDLTEIKSRIEDTGREMEDILSGRKLLEFIEQKSRDEIYSKRLGLISWIRKDFSRLDELLRMQHEVDENERSKIFNPQNVQLQIDRIILYIDDLDRCKEDIVVKVLEAIHLLLAFPLFVVIVGVDPRWLNNALAEKYKTLFGNHTLNSIKNNGATEQAQILTGAATSYDYLEKIFQIPFSLKPINKEGRENLITYLIRNEMENSQDNSGGTSDDSQNVQSESSPGNRESASEERQPESINRVRMTFSKTELEFMKKLSPLFGFNPRGINRYVNIYRIIKSHRSLKINDEYSEDDFIPVMFVLSIIIGYPVYAQTFIEKLDKASGELSLREFLNNSDIPGELNDNILNITDNTILELSLKSFKENLPLISRFSFRTITNTLEAAGNFKQMDKVKPKIENAKERLINPSQKTAKAKL